MSFDALINVDRHVVLAAELTANEEPGDVFDDLDQDLGDGQITVMPPLESGFRRFAFVEPGCAHNSAQLVIEDDQLTVQLLEDGSTDQQTDCGQAVYFLSVFDVPTGDVPQSDS